MMYSVPPYVADNKGASKGLIILPSRGVSQPFWIFSTRSRNASVTAASTSDRRFSNPRQFSASPPFLGFICARCSPSLVQFPHLSPWLAHPSNATQTTSPMAPGRRNPRVEALLRFLEPPNPRRLAPRDRRRLGRALSTRKNGSHPSLRSRRNCSSLRLTPWMKAGSPISKMRLSRLNS